MAAFCRIATVINPLKPVAGLLLLVMAGCASGPATTRGPASDWSSTSHSTPSINRTGLFPNTVTPLPSRQVPEPHSPGCVVVIDPGHGGHDSGTRSSIADVCEKDLTLDWARRLAELLSQAGCKAVLTRPTDMDVSLSNRVAFAAAQHASVFLSLHFNAAGGAGEQSGIETYCVTPVGEASNFTRGYNDDPALVFPNNQFDAANLELASRVHHALLRVQGAQDRGIRHARFLSVLRSQSCPAVLLEGGYLSNPAEAQRIAKPEYRQRLAQAVADALRDWLSRQGYVLTGVGPELRPGPGAAAGQ
jgi:N-acetylmuramoyl-L-alanine amidase